MGEINLPREQQDALAAIDTRELQGIIEEAVREERSGTLRQALLRCGPYVETQLHYFERALAAHTKAKAARKRAETASALQRAAYDVSSAVADMKRRVETERRDGELFFVEDSIRPPYRFSRQLSVRVSYRWRRTVDDQWMFGSITSHHEVDLRPDYTLPAPKRKPSAAKQERDLQDRLYQVWEHLMRGALYSVRDYFKDGGDGDAIPGTFQTTVDSYSRGLNNYSTQFWRNQPSDR